MFKPVSVVTLPVNTNDEIHDFVLHFLWFDCGHQLRKVKKMRGGIIMLFTYYIKQQLIGAKTRVSYFHIL